MALSKSQQAYGGFIAATDSRRDEVADVGVTEELKPKAAMIDTFVRPAEDRSRSSQLAQVAQSLRGFSRDLDGYMLQEAERQAEDDKAAGTAAFYQNNATAFAKAVEQGLIPANASRAFMNAYKEQEGRNLGMSIAAEVDAEWETRPERNSTDPAAADAWKRQRYSERLAAVKDPRVLRGAVPSIISSSERVADRQAKASGENAYRNLLQNTDREINLLIDEGKRTGATPEQIAAQIEERRERLRAVGVKEVDLDRAIITSVQQKARASGDEDLLLILDQKRPNGGRYSDLTEVREASYKTEEEIRRKRYIDEDREERQEARAGKKSAEEATLQVFQLWKDNPEAPVPEEILKQGEKGDPKFRLTVEQMRGQLFNTMEKEEPGKVRDAIMRIQRAGGDAMKVLSQEIAAGNLRSPNTIMKLADDAQRLGRANDRYVDTFQSQMWQEYEKRLEGLLDPKRLLVPGTGVSIPNVVRDPAQTAAEIQRGLNDTRLAFAQWLEQFPNATAEQRFRAGRQIQENFLSRFVTPGQNGQQGRLNYGPQQTPRIDANKRPEDLAPNGYRNPVAPGASPQPGVPPEIEDLVRLRQKTSAQQQEDIPALIRTVAAETRADDLEDFLLTTAAIESSGGRNLANPASSARGLFQFLTEDRPGRPSTWTRYAPGQDPMDPVANTWAAIRLARDNQNYLRKVLEREPTSAELYLAHQQGALGAATLLQYPNAPAWRMLGADAVLKNGGTKQMTSREFAQMWISKFEARQKKRTQSVTTDA